MSGGCAGWSGTTLWSVRVGTDPLGSHSFLTVAATVTYEVDAEASSLPTGRVYYKIKSGRLSYHLDGGEPDCQSTTTGEIAMVPDYSPDFYLKGLGHTRGLLQTYFTQGIPQYSGFDNQTVISIIKHEICHGVESTTVLPDLAVLWWDPDGVKPDPFTPLTLKNGGTLMEEDITYLGTNMSTRYQWRLQKIGK